MTRLLRLALSKLTVRLTALSQWLARVAPSGDASPWDAEAAAAQLALSEERHVRAMEASNAGYWDWNLLTGEVFLSERLKQVVDFPPDTRFTDHDEFIGHIPFHPDDRDSVARTVAAALRGDTERYEIDYRLVLPSGETRWVRALGKVFRDEHGRAVRLAETLSDVSEQLMAQEALRESEARFRSLTELLFDWYWRQDENLRFTYLSSQAQTLTGYTGESSYGKLRWELPGMTPLSGSWTEHQAVLAQRQPFRDLECCRTGADGVRRYLSMSGTPIFDAQGRFKGYHGIGRNITERKRIEEELRARQEMLDLAQKAARAAAFDWPIGAGQGPARWSRELEALFGLDPGSDVTGYEGWKGLICLDDWPAVEAAIKRARKTGEVAVEHRVIQADGSVRWLQLRGRIAFAEHGEPIRMVGFMLDVTERRRAEEQLRRLERQLRQAQRVEAIGTLAGGIAHDFNNILGAILGYGEMALRDAPKGTRLRRDLDSIMTATERGRALVDQILMFSRNSMNERAAVHLEGVVREALNLLAGNLPPGVTLVRHLQAGRAAVLGDGTQMHQVVMNLVTNASQAMPAGGAVRVLLEPVHVDAPRVAATGEVQPGDYVVLEVADSGTGIQPDIMDRIFDPFFTTKGVGVGTGLGLSLVHGIVTELGGAINVASELGVGSVFTVYFPRAGDAIEGGPQEVPDVPRGNRERVLVVDDEEPLMAIAVETLEDFGYQAVGYTSSSAALAAFRANPQGFDAVVTDERMPGMSGSALIGEVHRIRAGIPALLMSGFMGATPAGESAPGVAELLKKPLSRHELAASLARALTRARQEVDRAEE